MALGTCIPDLIAQGKIPADRAEQIRARYDEMVRGYEPRLGRAAAEAEATRIIVSNLESDVIAKQNAQLKQRKVQGEWLGRMTADAGDGPFKLATAIDYVAQIDKKIDTVRGSAFASLDEFLAKHRRNLLGQIRDKSDLADVLRERFGQSTGNVNAREFSQAMGDVMEMLRQRFNQAGGRIGKLEQFVFPQRHDQALVRAVSFEEWADFGPISRARLIDLETGEPASGMKRLDILRRMYENIRADGASKAKPGQMFAGSLASRRSDPRLIHFDNPDDWLEYQGRFGGADNIYDIFVGHVESMVRDIALMEEMGPNPTATLRFMKDWMEKSIKLKGSQSDIDNLGSVDGKLGRMYDVISGNNHMVENRRLALAFSAFRAQQVAAKLGSAILSAVPDMATMMKTANFNGIPAMKMVGRYAKLWTGAQEDRALAVRAGLITQDWLTLTSASYRYNGEELTGEIARRMSDFVIRAQGLGRHTRNGQWAFGMETISWLTHNKAKGWDDIDPATRAMMERHQLGRQDWDNYRASDTIEERGAEWLLPTEIADKRLGERFLQMILTETDYAIIMPDARTRAMMAGMPKAGTWLGEIMRSSLLFKGFPLAVLSLHGRRMLEQGGIHNKAKYGLTLLGMMTVGGAISVQLKQVAAGKDPQPMEDPRFAGRALIQSGGLGLFGDLIYNSENSFGGGVAKTLLGPVLGQTLGNALAIPANSAVAAFDGDPETDTTLAKDSAKLLLNEIPGRNLWYTRLAYERGFADMIREWSDEDIAGAYAQQEQRAEKEGTAYYAPPGAGLSGMRAPDFANAFAEVQE
jgi:hypothetical protein